MAAYFIRRQDDVCAVIELHADDREEVVEDGLSPFEAEILCLAKMGDFSRAAQPMPDAAAPETEKPKRRKARQLEMKF